MMETRQCMCKVCGERFEDTVESAICIPCENEYAEWLDAKGYEVGEYDCYDHPNFVPDPHKGTKWERLDG